jgi:hypothetical protein
VFVAGEGVFGRFGLILLPVPNPHHALASGRKEPPVGRTECHGKRRPKLSKGVARSFEHLDRRLRGQIPNPDPLVGAGRGEVSALGMKHDAAGRLVVGRDFPKELSGAAIANPDKSIPARGGE